MRITQSKGANWLKHFLLFTRICCSLVEEMAHHLVPVFIISRKRHKEIAQSLVDQISEITRMDRRMLIYKYWDGIFERWVLAKIREPAVTADIDTYLYHWIQNNRVGYRNHGTVSCCYST